MKKTLVLALALVAIFSLSATKKPAKPVCGPLVTIHNSLYPAITVTSVDISGPGAGTFTTPPFNTSYSVTLGTFTPTFDIHLSGPAPAGSVCLSNNVTGALLYSGTLPVGSTTVTVSSPTMTCSSYTLTISRGPDCPLPPR